MHDLTHAKTFLMFFGENLAEECSSDTVWYMLQFPVVSSNLVISMHAEIIPSKRYFAPRPTAAKPRTTDRTEIMYGQKWSV